MHLRLGEKSIKEEPHTRPFRPLPLTSPLFTTSTAPIILPSAYRNAPRLHVFLIAKTTMFIANLWFLFSQKHCTHK
ncbi:transmembrane protein, putative [Bodo saltans]|uniref:Transmembrane protein, putative n=1 Tax=Bodo saltans TaxID=75058 RepID=A0A0S4JQ72_BODSA|nr:transmembrane protein, putative [Bodo saltans]|eukprot:CUG92108.1 transmembrane protein, putative [Bodo saltans]